MQRLPPGTSIRRTRKASKCRFCKKAIPKNATVLAYHVLPKEVDGDHGYEHACQFCAQPRMR
jgi:hypothetical protein